MSGTVGKRAVYAFTLIAVVTFALLLAVALQRLVQAEKDLSSGVSESLLWALAQAQYEEQRLVLEAYAWSQGSRTAEDSERLRDQLDIVFSRLAILSEGSVGRGLSAAVGGGLVAAGFTNLQSFEGRVRTLIASRAAIPQEMLDKLLLDAAAFRSAANDIMIRERDTVSERRDQYRYLLLEAIVAVLLVLGCGVFIVVRLMTSLRSAARAEDALRRDRDFSRLLLESSGDGVVAFDREFRCTHWNPALGEMFPVLEGTGAVGRSIPEAYRLSDDHIIMKMMRQTLQGESLHMPAHAIPGGKRYIEKFTHPIMSGDAIIGGILFFRDVTDTHSARLELVEHRDQLETIVRERTRDLEESLKRETDLRELYKGFVSMVSHQFRTPLSIVDSSAQRMIRRGKEMDENEIHERAGKIRAAALRLTRLVSSTLNAAKVDAGQIDVAMRRCDLGKLVVEACERQKETAPGREFRLKLNGLPPLVSCDPLLVDQVIANLLSNAIKYSAAPDPVDVSADVGREWIRLKVCDRGVGIPEEERPKLFERFFRASTSAGVEGTGIGLHVARTIARLHGGDVEARPRRGGGSSFILSIPREEIAA